MRFNLKWRPICTLSLPIVTISLTFVSELLDALGALDSRPVSRFAADPNVKDGFA